MCIRHVCLAGAMVLTATASAATAPVARYDFAKDASDSGGHPAGATLPKRDAVDARILREYEAGTGRIIDSQETQHSLDPKDPSDGSKDNDSDGYANLEECLNGTHPSQPGS